MLLLYLVIRKQDITIKTSNHMAKTRNQQVAITTHTNYCLLKPLLKLFSLSHLN